MVNHVITPTPQGATGRVYLLMLGMKGPGSVQRDGGYEYNYRRGEPLKPRDSAGLVAEFAATAGTDAATFMRQRPGMSAFAREDGVVYHTYSAYARGLDGLWGMYQWLDRAPKGRNETGLWWRRHDEYDKR